MLKSLNAANESEKEPTIEFNNIEPDTFVPGTSASGLIL